MVKKTIQFKDFNGNDVVKDYYFNLTIDEILEMNYSKKEGLQEYIDFIIQSNDSMEIYTTFKKIILAAIGEKSDDGVRFIKRPEIAEEFSQTNAFSELILSLMSNPDEAATFIKSIIPMDRIETFVADHKSDAKLPA